MIQLHFYPEWNDSALTHAAAEYQAIWRDSGASIVEALQRRTGLQFVEGEINALVYEGRSASEPMVLRGSYPREIKIGVLVHELGHRLLSGNGIRATRGDHYNTHRLLQLVLYDSYCELFGEAFAKRMVEWESKLGSDYQAAWDWSLSLSMEERVGRFERIKGHREDWLRYLEGDV